MKPVCSKCHKVIETQENIFTTGYGLDKDNNKVCYDCCAIEDAEYMKNNKRICLYLNTNKKIITNWPGSLKIQLNYIKTGRHNIAGKRYDVWFKYVGKNWHGTQYGDNTEICHCLLVSLFINNKCTINAK